MRAIKNNFSDIFDKLKLHIADSNLTLEEISENIGVSEELLAIFLDPDNEVIDSVSRLFRFMNISLYSRELEFKPYSMKQNGTQIRLIRRIKPYCSIYFDTATQEFYKFTMKYKKIYLSDNHKMLIMSEMKDYLQSNM